MIMHELDLWPFLCGGSAGTQHVARDIPPEAILLLTGTQLHMMNHLQTPAFSKATDEKH